MSAYFLKDESVIFLAPMVMCKTLRRRWDDDTCRHIPLPFPTLQGLDEDHSDWPPVDWSATIACIDCGHVYTYRERDVQWGTVRKSSEGKYRNETNCFYVELKCAEKDCKALVQFHVEMHDKKKVDLEREIKKGFVGTWPGCEHPALAEPFAAYKIEQVYLGPI